jgi:hypothetical protein
VTAFFNFLYDFGAEGFKITRVPGCDNALVDDDFCIFPMCASVGDVSFYRFVGRHPATLRNTGLYEEPGRVTNGRDDFFRVKDVLDELQRLWLNAQKIRIDLARVERLRRSLRLLPHPTFCRR